LDKTASAERNARWFLMFFKRNPQIFWHAVYLKSERERDILLYLPAKHGKISFMNSAGFLKARQRGVLL
jgi:hypothetical protein